MEQHRRFFTRYRIPGVGRIASRTSPFCTAWSDLPIGYDDCTTAGIASLYRDIPGFVELSFGTFKAPLIERGREYYGFWILKGLRGAGSTTSVKLYGQEGKFLTAPLDRNQYCLRTGADNIWCVLRRQEGSILESGTTWSYGTPSYTTYIRP